jgi:hypothetical protein
LELLEEDGKLRNLKKEIQRGLAMSLSFGEENSKELD